MNSFEKNIINIYGNQGKKWLEELPNITADLATRYALTDLLPVANMTFNYVATGHQADKPIILKLGLNAKALAKEAHCLKAFAAHGTPDILESDTGIIIMGRAVPGTTLKEYFPSKDTDAIAILCEIIHKLHLAETPAQHNFYNVTYLLQTLDNDLNIPIYILNKARKLRDDLLATTEHTVLLHGDLHHDNILKNGNEWIVIDPKGFIGDPAFEPAAFIGNPIHELLEQKFAKKIIEQRINLCAQLLHLSEKRISNWLYVKTVLCWAWCLEDNLDPKYFANLISTIS